MSGVKGMTATVYRGRGDCSNGGVSSRVNQVVVIDDMLPPIFVPNAAAPAVKLVRRGGYLHAEPMERRAGAGPMFGGTFIWSSDSRFRAVSEYPIPLHDRWEA